jgi:hypothetical protein
MLFHKTSFRSLLLLFLPLSLSSSPKSNAELVTARRLRTAKAKLKLAGAYVSFEKTNNRNMKNPTSFNIDKQPSNQAMKQ